MRPRTRPSCAHSSLNGSVGNYCSFPATKSAAWLTLVVGIVDDVVGVDGCTCSCVAAICANGCGDERFVAPRAAHHGRVQIGVGVSTATDARQAAVEAATHARDELAGAAPSLAVLFASRSHAD